MKEIKAVTIFIDENLHEKMKEIANRTRQQIGPIYEAAIKSFLLKPKNYMGKEEK
jgi:predicted transcriptional regulator